MALIWQCERGGTRYEVRRHGSTVRLVSDGVFHSAYNARTGLTGRVWDLLLVAAFAAPEPPRRILVLGTGGGTALLQYRRFLDPEQLIGVDYDPVHLKIARRFFGVTQACARLVQADAREWVRRWDGPRFDLVVEDLYGHAAGSPQRTVPMDARWARALERLLTDQGVLAVNFISTADLAACAQLTLPGLRSRYESILRLRVPRDENALAVFCRRKTTAAEVRRRLRGAPRFEMRSVRNHPCYMIRTLC